MFSSYTDFEIEFQPRNGEVYAISARGPAGEGSSTLHSPSDDPAFQQLCARLAIFDTDEEILCQIGNQLFNALFSGEIGKLYAASRSMLEEDQGIVIRLRIPAGAEEIAALPWEFTAEPGSEPLVLLDAPIARYLPQPTPLPTLHATLPLKVLLTGAQTPPPAAIERELQAVKDALEGLGDHVQIQLVPHLTAAALREHLREEFHIWHFVGHGGFDKAGTTAQLLFEDASGDSDSIGARELNIMLNRSGIRLVVLNACNSGKLAIEPFRSIAPALIRAQIPAVVAQQFKVPEEATRAFVTDFYRSLARGFPIDDCITEGRKAIMNSCGLGQADWGIPVLYTRMVSGRLFDPPEVTPAAEPMPAATTAPTAASMPSAAPAQALVPTPGDTRATERAEQIATLTAQLQAKRREQRMIRLRKGIYNRPQAHLTRQYEQLSGEIHALIDQITAAEG
jgi:CHAT domain-containing protein